jgi:hypothetical protein
MLLAHAKSLTLKEPVNLEKERIMLPSGREKCGWQEQMIVRLNSFSSSLLGLQCIATNPMTRVASPS